MKADIARRGIFWIFGNRAFEFAMRNVNEGDEVDWGRINFSGWKKALLYNSFYSAEMLKKSTMDYW